MNVMPLSQAIRLGLMWGAKASGEFFMPDGSMCVQGAALAAMGVDQTLSAEALHDKLAELWPWAAVTRTFCPACTNYDTVKNHLPHLNNRPHPWFGSQNHDWTREQIADQVEVWEKEFEALADRRLKAETPQPTAEPVTC